MGGLIPSPFDAPPADVAAPAVERGDENDETHEQTDESILGGTYV